MSLRKILAPHKEQDGWRYIRVPSSITTPMGKKHQDAIRMFRAAITITSSLVGGTEHDLELSYRDTEPWSRIISSRRVERAVETDDFLRLCAEEELSAKYAKDSDKACWQVEPMYFNDEPCVTITAYAATLREAYYRYHAAAGDPR